MLLQRLLFHSNPGIKVSPHHIHICIHNVRYAEFGVVRVCAELTWKDLRQVSPISVYDSQGERRSVSHRIRQQRGVCLRASDSVSVLDLVTLSILRLRLNPDLAIDGSETCVSIIASVTRRIAVGANHIFLFHAAFCFALVASFTCCD